MPLCSVRAAGAAVAVIIGGAVRSAGAELFVGEARFSTLCVLGIELEFVAIFQIATVCVGPTLCGLSTARQGKKG